MNGKQVRERLHSGKVTYGTHVTLMSNSISASLLAKANLDYVFLCAEHMPLDRVEASALCRIYASQGISPIVRISSVCPAEACRALDCGAQGIVVPYIETIEQVKEMVGAVHYRPIKGKMLQNTISGHRKPSNKTTEFLSRFNENNYLIIGVESIEAYENLDALINIEGVDGVFIGPHDVSVSLEAPEEWDNPELHRIFEDIVVRCRAANIGVGVHMQPSIFPNKRAKRLIDLGMNWILDGADVTWAIHAINERRKAIDILPVLENNRNAEFTDISSCTTVNEI